MNRVSFIKEYCDLGDTEEKQSLFNAFVQSLTPTESCAALDLLFQQEPKRRQAILRKILRDCEYDFEDCHADLFFKIVDTVEHLSAHKRQSCGYTLSFLYKALPPDLQDYLLRYFLVSGSIKYRRRGYNILKEDWNQGYGELLQSVWAKHHDYGCAALLIKHCSSDYLESNFDDLERDVYGTHCQKDLYLRVAPDNPSLLPRLAQQDEITFAYVLVKLRHRLNENEAIAIYERNKYDSRLGLLLWCIGQMGHWSVLEQISTEIEDIPGERYRIFIREYAT